MTSRVRRPAKNSKLKTQNFTLSRRDFLARSALLAISALAPGCQTLQTARAEPIIDIHQHLGYSGRPDDVLVAHQQAMGISKTILLPAGRPMLSPATHEGRSNGLEAQCYGNLSCSLFARAHRPKFLFGANDVPDVNDAVRQVEKYLQLGAIVIAEQKFGVDCDSAGMQRLYAMAADYQVPILMHWQHAMYNYGLQQFTTDKPRETLILSRDLAGQGRSEKGSLT